MTGSTRRLSEVARHLVIPEGIVTSQFPRVYRRLQEVGVGFDEWQQGFGRVALGCRESGTYAATVGGVVASIPRQVGKTYTVGNLIIGLCLEFPGLRVIWTSHHNRTTTNTFRSMQGMVQTQKVLPFLAVNGIRTANGEQEIRFANGSIIMFGAREQGFGRGMDAIDIEVFDEAQILGVKALEDMVPATNAAQHEHGALVFFMGTPPRPTDDGAAFATKRRRALDGKSPDQMYVELSADPDADSDDREQWALMNPSYPHRTPLESMLRMRENIPDEESWRREAMGIWPSDADEGPATWQVIDEGTWGDLIDMQPERTGPIAISVDATPLTDWWTVAAAQRTVNGKIHLEVGFHKQVARSEVLSYVIGLVRRWKPCAVVIDRKSPAMILVPELLVAKIEAETTTAPQMVAACTGFYNDATHGDLSHVDSDVLASAIEGAVQRNVTGGGWAWNRTTNAVISPLVAATLARWGLMEFGALSAPPKQVPTQKSARTRSTADGLMAAGF